MKLIPLTQGQVAKVDDGDFVLFGGLKWFAQFDPSTGNYYAARKFPIGNGKQGVILLHRAVVGAKGRAVKVDHKNHDTLDCRRSNLRSCSNSQNLMNRSGLDANNTSGVRGVSWYKRSGKWAAKIRVNMRLLHLGYFDKKSDAAAAYAEANKKHFGEFGGRIK